MRTKDKSGFNPWSKNMVLSAAESYYSTLFIALDHRFGRQGETTALQIEQQFQDAVDPAVNILLGQDVAFRESLQKRDSDWLALLLRFRGRDEAGWCDEAADIFGDGF